MKNILSILAFILLFVLSTSVALADEGDNRGPGDPGGEPTGEEPLGGGAPIGGGTIMLLAMGVAYGGKKLYNMKKEDL